VSEEGEQEEENEDVTYAYKKISSEQCKDMVPIRRRLNTAGFNEFNIVRKKRKGRVQEIVTSQERQNFTCDVFTDY
jgi:hypothetical protein